VVGGLVEAELRDAASEAKGLGGTSPSAVACGVGCHGRDEAPEKRPNLPRGRGEGKGRRRFIVLLLLHFLYGEPSGVRPRE
jgi:hypothetical protein